MFQGVQQPVCIVMASRSADNDEQLPADVRFRALPKGHRQAKFTALARVRLGSDDWIECPKGWRDPFLPVSAGAWSSFPALEDLFVYNGSGAMPGRTWVIASDPDTLKRRWAALLGAPESEKEDLFHPHLRKDKPGDKHVYKRIEKGLPGQPNPLISVAEDEGRCIPPIRYGFRSFDRQWLIPDARLINQPNPGLWTSMSDRQIYLTALSRTSPTAGPALTATALIPDLDHFNARGGRVFPLWLDDEATTPNLVEGVLRRLAERFGRDVKPEEFLAYIVAVIASPTYTDRFRDDLSTPGLRVPISATTAVFEKGVELGRRVVWLQTFGERMVDNAAGRPAGPPRLPNDRAPKVPADGSISTAPGAMADTLDYDARSQRLLVGRGHIENVTPSMWVYEVSGMRVLQQWFSYRRANRERPLIGDKRPPSRLIEIQPDSWLSEYTTELLNVLNVIGLLVDLEPQQEALLEEVCAGDLISDSTLRDAGAFDLPVKYPTKPFRTREGTDGQLALG